ncbi:MAG: hypothetical protein IT359_09100 [Gemmatimonadaceae bacterium]|nr:hypothetical protein [Gemmatimonadaceae bacterium]
MPISLAISRRAVRVALAPAAILALVAIAACADERASVAPPRPVPMPISANAWILVSDTLARAGHEVTISAFARADSGGAVGSFTARFLYDSLQLQLIGPDSVSDAALRAVNPVVGEYRVAGAAARGIPEGLLFRMRARVIDRRGLRRLGLLVDELHSVSLADLTPRLTVSDTRAALYAGMPNVRVAPAPKVQP